MQGRSTIGLTVSDCQYSRNIFAESQILRFFRVVLVLQKDTPRHLGAEPPHSTPLELGIWLARRGSYSVAYLSARANALKVASII